jgi:two-component system, chemotaxis family, response regulator Rcp1
VNQRASKILIIDDNEGDVFLVKEALRREGLKCEIVLLRDGAAGVAFLRSAEAAANCPDCIVLDLNLPKVRGDQVLTAIREHPHMSRVPVLVWSSPQNREAGALKDQSQGTLFFEKSAKLHEFLAIGPTIRALLEGTAATRAPAS